jgi:hypothetical protein
MVRALHGLVLCVTSSVWHSFWLEPCTVNGLSVAASGGERACECEGARVQGSEGRKSEICQPPNRARELPTVPSVQSAGRGRVHGQQPTKSSEGTTHFAQMAGTRAACPQGSNQANDVHCNIDVVLTPLCGQRNLMQHPFLLARDRINDVLTPLWPT